MDDLYNAKPLRHPRPRAPCHKILQPSLVACLDSLVDPTVCLRVGASSCEVGQRSRGLLTGTQSAMLLSRVPVLEVAMRRAPFWHQWGYRTDDGSSIALASWVDNLFSAAQSAADAVAILHDAELHLEAQRGLLMGDDSKQFMPARGATDEKLIGKGWEKVRHFKGLAHWISHDGSIEHSWNGTKRSVWQAW